MSLNNNPEIAKLILVGQTSTGKTAIYNRIIFDTFNENSISTLSHSTSTREINVDEDGHGRSMLEDSLFYAKLYLMLLITMLGCLRMITKLYLIEPWKVNTRQI